VTRGARPRRRGAHATRPKAPLRRRLRPRLPSLGRALAALLFAATLAGLVVLVNGPWLRVAQISVAGQQLTGESALAGVLEPLRGSSLLALDAAAVADRLRTLPAVAEARVQTGLLDRVEVTIDEKQPTFVWRTETHRLVGADDGTLIGEVPRDGDLPKALARLPYVDDRRAAAIALGIGSRIEPAVLQTALRLASLDPARLGSAARRLSIRLDDEFGFVLVASRPSWQVAFGVSGMQTGATQTVTARIDEQLAAVRTLFATRRETSVWWVDARNPGKVYFRAKG